MTNRSLYRALHPAWAFAPLEGRGASINGGRWNRKGVKAIYLATDPMTAVREYNQDLQFLPVTLAQYRLTNARIADLDASELLGIHVASAIHAVAWRAMNFTGSGTTPMVSGGRLDQRWLAWWRVSFSNNTNRSLHCPVVLEPKRGREPCLVDPDARLPKDQDSWPK